MTFRKFCYRVYLIALVIGVCAISVVQGQSGRDIAQKAFPSVVMLVMEDSQGQQISLGSGFFVKEDIIATNLHVIEGAAQGYAKIISKKLKYDITGFVAIDQRTDLVLLKLKGVKAPVLSLGDSNQVAIGDEVYAIGNPHGLEGTFSKGIVSGIRKVGEDTLLQITAPISPGSSGGPVLNTEGKVIGVAVATFKGGQNLNFAIPTSYLAPLLSDTKLVKPLSTEEKNKKKKRSIFDDLGGKSTEGVVGIQLVWKFKLSQIGEYSFSLRNKLRNPVENVFCLVVFYDRNGEPIDIDIVKYRGIIPAGLAKRVTSEVDDSIQELTTSEGSATPHTKVEFRILDFEIIE